MLKVIILALAAVLTGQIGSNLLPKCKLCGSYMATNRSKELLQSFCHGGNVTGDRCCIINNRLLGYVVVIFNNKWIYFYVKP